MELKEIKENLILACLNQNPKIFLPYLLSNNVKTTMPNKIRFYSFFKYMINCGKQKSIGNWALKIEKTTLMNEQHIKAYNFYDNKHKSARLKVLVIEENNEITIETIPF